MKIRATLQQELGDLQVNSLETGGLKLNGFWRRRRTGGYARSEDVQGCRSIVVWRIHISPMRQQLFDDAEFEIADGAMKGRVTGSVSGIHEGRVLLQKITDPRDIPNASCVVDAEQKRSSLEEMADQGQHHADDGTDEGTNATTDTPTSELR